jgi:hypothetical protein
VLVAAAFSGSIAWTWGSPVLVAILAIIGLGLLVFIARLPARRRGS